MWIKYNKKCYFNTCRLLEHKDEKKKKKSSDLHHQGYLNRTVEQGFKDPLSHYRKDVCTTCSSWCIPLWHSKRSSVEDDTIDTNENFLANST